MVWINTAIPESESDASTAMVAIDSDGYITMCLESI
jgi:hypothetical protein